MWNEEPLFRPPAEADSVIFQVSRGCPHNSCLFCGMYKTVKYRQVEMSEFRRALDAASKRHPDARRVFLADGDAMALPFERLKETLELLGKAFPLLSRVSSYANGSSIAAKSDSELAALKERKMSILYMGLESGDESLLKLLRKGESAEGMCEAVRRAQTAGLKCSVMALVGVGGRRHSLKHAEATFEALNRMRPKLLSVLRFIEVPGLRMFEGYETLSEHASAVELKSILEGLSLDGTVFRANHSSIPYPLEGRLPKDKAKLIETLDRLINSYILDKDGPGRTPLWL